MKNRAVFFDKDGTLIDDVPYNVEPSRIKLKKNAAETVRQIKQAGFLIFIITNQSGVARGFFAETALIRVWEKLEELCGIKFDGIYYCPHLTDCNCRKPQPGMLLRAALEHSIDLGNSFFVGDSASDIEAGRRAGCRTILFDEQRRDEIKTADFTIAGLSEILNFI